MAPLWTCHTRRLYLHEAQTYSENCAGMAAKKEARRYLILDHVERIREADVLAVLLRVRELTGEIAQTLKFCASLRVRSCGVVCCVGQLDNVCSFLSQSTTVLKPVMSANMQCAGCGNDACA